MATMPWVAKFGGSSFRTTADYRRIARYLLDEVSRLGRPGVVVVSAMPGETEGLRQRLTEVNPAPSYRGTAGLLTLADVVSAYLLQEAVNAEGGRALALPQHRHGITTDRTWMSARIVDLDPTPVRQALADHDIVVLPGGPAGDEAGNPTWMGKNSSDLAAVATAAGLGAGEVSIHSDVHGIYTADPNLVTDAEVIPAISYGTASLLSARGAKVLHQRSVLLAKQHGIAIRCKGNEAPFPSGTVISASAPPISAVVIDLRSELVALADHTQARAAYTLLADKGVHVVLPSDTERPVLAVTGGFVDVGRHLREADVDFTPVPGRLVSEIHGTSTTTHFAEDDDAALTLGRSLHTERRHRLSVPAR